MKRLWWVTPLVAAGLVYLAMGYIDIQDYPFLWPLLPIGFVAYWIGEAIHRTVTRFL